MLKIVFFVSAVLMGCSLAKKADVSYEGSSIKTGMILSLDFPKELAWQECLMLISGRNHHYKLNFADIAGFPIFLPMEPDTYNLEKISCSSLGEGRSQEYSMAADYMRQWVVQEESVSVVLPLMIKQAGPGHLSIHQERNFKKKALSKIHSVVRDSENLISAHNGSVVGRSFFKDGSRTPIVQVMMSRSGVNLQKYSNLAGSCYEQEIVTNILPLGRESVRWNRSSKTVTVESANLKTRLNNYSQTYVNCILGVVNGARSDSSVQSMSIDF